ncbi:MAG: hypothetical protein KY456_17205, partial [Chloroflexi bacterium]|nr:hypothetical protein [Chloroflexota bacterium]
MMRISVGGSRFPLPGLHSVTMMSDSGRGDADPDAGQPGWNATLYAVWAGQVLALIGFSSRVPFL